MPSPDTLLLLRTERLDSKQRGAAWFKRIDAVGATLLVWPIDAKEMPAWIAQRSRRAGLELSRDALSIWRTASKVICSPRCRRSRSSRLSGLPQPVTLAALTAAGRRCGALRRIRPGRCSAGQAKRRGYGTSSGCCARKGWRCSAILGALTCPAARFMNGDYRGMPQAKDGRCAPPRAPASATSKTLSRCAWIDQQVKGAADGDPWQTLEYDCVATRRRYRSRLARTAS